MCKFFLCSHCIFRHGPDWRHEKRLFRPGRRRRKKHRSMGQLRVFAASRGGSHGLTIPTMFETLLIANRGEIACRIIETARRLGLRTIAVYSDADAESRHVALADSAFHIGPSPARDSYLEIDRLVAANRRSVSDAVAPG